MQRRQFLERAALVSVFGLAGCVSRGEPDGGPATDPDDGPTSANPTETDTPRAPEQPTTTPTATGTPRDERESETPTADRPPGGTPAMPQVLDTAFAVVDSDGGQQRDAASVSFDEAAGTVTVAGTIWGRDACQTAELDAVELSRDELTVSVREATASEDGMCAQVIVEIDYEATVTLDALPERVVVAHDHGDGPTEVASASR